MKNNQASNSVAALSAACQVEGLHYNVVLSAKRYEYKNEAEPLYDEEGEVELENHSEPVVDVDVVLAVRLRHWVVPSCSWVSGDVVGVVADPHFIAH